MAATDRFRQRRLVQAIALQVSLLAAAGTSAKVLPEDRGDVLYHRYEGGGVAIDGPSVLVRKSYKDRISVWGNYYADMISGASIDVEATASPYVETRTEFSVGVDYLHDKTLMGVGFTRSEENDYEASTIRFSISQDFFGDMTTVNLGFALGDDTVMRNGDEGFSEAATHHSYRVEVSQVMTPSVVLNIGYESVVDEGYLNNPYRSVRYADPTLGPGYGYQAEVYPRTRTSDAVALRGMAYLPWRAAIRGEVRQYEDSWGIEAMNGELSYTHPIGSRWELDARARYYTQDAADFYADLFPFRDAQNYLARDKELATFESTSVGIGVAYLFSTGGFFIFDRGSLNLQVDYAQYDYADFRDVTAGGEPGDEPLYSFDATIIRAYLSVWF